MKANQKYDREAARQAYLKRKAFSAPLQPILDKNFNEARNEDELLAVNGKAIQAHLTANSAA